MNRNMSTARSTTPLEQRLKLVIAHATGNMPDWKLMERSTSINAQKWRNFANGLIKASPDMIEAVAQTWPDFAYWLSTGLTEPETGHVAATTYVPRYPVMRGQAIPSATEERRRLIEELRKVPVTEEGLSGQSRDLSDVVFKAREAQHMPGLWLNHERIARELDEPVIPELFPLELDEDLVKLRQTRFEQQIKLLKAIYTHRKHNLQLMPVEKGISLLVGGVKKIFKKWQQNANQGN